MNIDYTVLRGNINRALDTLGKAYEEKDQTPRWWWLERYDKAKARIDFLLGKEEELCSNPEDQCTSSPYRNLIT